MSNTPTTIERIWEVFGSSLHRFIERRVSDPHLADDVLQDVFLRVYRGIDSLSHEDRLAAWLYQITRNTMVDHLRRRDPAVQIPDDLAIVDRKEDDAIDQELANCITAMAAALPDTYREAVQLAELRGHTQREVAGMLGLSVSGAKSRVQRGREELKNMLLACCSIELDRRGNPLDWKSRNRCGDCGRSPKNGT